MYVLLLETNPFPKIGMIFALGTVIVLSPFPSSDSIGHCDLELEIMLNKYSFNFFLPHLHTLSQTRLVEFNCSVSF